MKGSFKMGQMQLGSWRGRALAPVRRDQGVQSGRASGQGSRDDAWVRHERMGRASARAGMQSLLSLKNWGMQLGCPGRLVHAPH